MARARGFRPDRMARQLTINNSRIGGQDWGDRDIRIEYWKSHIMPLQKFNYIIKFFSKFPILNPRAKHRSNRGLEFDSEFDSISPPLAWPGAKPSHPVNRRRRRTSALERIKSFQNYFSWEKICGKICGKKYFDKKWKILLHVKIIHKKYIRKKSLVFQNIISTYTTKSSNYIANLIIGTYYTENESWFFIWF